MANMYETVQLIKDSRDRLASSIKRNAKIAKMKGTEIFKPYMQSIDISNDKARVYMVISQSNLNRDKIMVDIENIVFDRDIQRKGLCTDLVNVILSDKRVDAVLISQVLTQEMEDFCKSRKFMKIDKENNTYCLFKTKELRSE